MAGRINEEDIALVRERAHIEDVVGSYVMLKSAGSGSLKGLCPFHDEKTPSFQVTPARGLFYCFGCGEGGDVITFLQKIDNLTFSEAVQTLADRTGVQLRIEDDGAPRAEPGLRARLMAANEAAAEFFARQLLSPDALAARQMLDSRGFDRAVSEKFSVGYAPRGGRELANQLRRQGFKDSELVAAGLIRQGGYDFFQGRLLWPIKDSAKSVLGFGARRLHDDDRMPAKYINTPESPIYKKSSVLYGLDLSRQAIGKKSQAVVMEGYTDVMAAHLSGVDTAVASCGTAFGVEHARLLQRLMGDHDAFNGEVIFTFDGDQAGQNAALKVFNLDQKFAAQTYVAVAREGLDPCDLRLQHGDAAVRDLVGRRIPLYRYVMEHVVARHDLDRADGRLAAVRAAAPMVNSIRDNSLVPGYLRELSALVGMDIEDVRRIVAQEGRRKLPEVSDTLRQRPAPEQPVPDDAAPTLDGLTLPWPDASDHNLGVERGTLKLMLQCPTLFTVDWNAVQAGDFTHPAYRAVFEAIQATPYEGEHWVERVQQSTADETARQLEIALLVEPPLRQPDQGYVDAYTSKLRLITTLGLIRDVKSRLQRTNPVEHRTEYNQLFTRFLELETQRQQLQQQSIGLSE